MEWSEESLLNLIDIYKAQPVLWSPTDENYFKKNKKADAWRDISSTIGRSDEECRKKIISLLSSYRREKARIKTSTGTGTGTSQVYKSRWFAFEAFRFLEDRDKPRQRFDTEPDEDVVTEQTVDESSVVIHTEEADREFTPPIPPPKRIRKHQKQSDSTALLASAVNILESTAGKLHSSSLEDPETKTFCAFLASKMMNYSAVTKRMVQHAIYDLLIKADVGALETAARREQLFSPISSYPRAVPSYTAATQPHSHFEEFHSSTSFASTSTPRSSPTELPTIPPLVTTFPPHTSISQHIPSISALIQHSVHTPSPSDSCESQYSDDLNENI